MRWQRCCRGRLCLPIGNRASHSHPPSPIATLRILSSSCLSLSVCCALLTKAGLSRYERDLLLGLMPCAFECIGSTALQFEPPTHRQREDNLKRLSSFFISLLAGYIGCAGNDVAAVACVCLSGLLVKIVDKIETIFVYWSKIVDKCGSLPAFSTCICRVCIGNCAARNYNYANMGLFNV